MKKRTKIRKESGDSSKKASSDRCCPQGSVISYKRIIARVVIIVCFALGTYVYGIYQTKEVAFAKSKELVTKTSKTIECSRDYDRDRKLFPECAPKVCGRVVTDIIVSQSESVQLLNMAKRALAHGGSNGGASILDLHSGAISKGDKFVDVYTLLSHEDDSEKVFTQADFDHYAKIKNRIQSTIANAFDLNKFKLHLASPTFFSEMTSKDPKTVHDQYWHTHVDKETYGSFDYTSLLYLSTYGEDFWGGRFVFQDGLQNSTVEPRTGRLSFFTSGSENTHFVERVENGTRYALTVSFTCDPSKAIKDPKLRL